MGDGTGLGGPGVEVSLRCAAARLCWQKKTSDVGKALCRNVTVDWCAGEKDA